MRAAVVVAASAAILLCTTGSGITAPQAGVAPSTTQVGETEGKVPSSTSVQGTPPQLVAGLNDHPLWLRDSQATEFSYLKASHAKAVRVDAMWDVLDGGSKGTYDRSRLALLDAYVDRCVHAKIDVLLIVVNAPQWANHSTDPRVPPINDSDYADFLQFLVTHFEGRVHAYEIWNEPDGNWSWRHPDAVRYASLLKAAYTRAKSVDPSVTVLAPSLSGAFTGGWLDTFYAQGTKNYFDAFSMHGYFWNFSRTMMVPYYDPTNPGQSIFGAFTTRILPIMTRYGDQAKPVWWTETGIASEGSVSTEAQAAAGIDSAYSAFRHHVVPTMTRLYWYDMLDSIGPGDANNFGLIDLTGTSATTPTAEDFRPKTTYAHFQNQATLTR